jgi:hypothetical protein
MPSVLVASVGRDSGWETLHQPSLEALGALIAALGTEDVFEIRLQRSVYLPEENRRVYEPQLTILGEQGRYHLRVWFAEEMYCYRGGDPQATGEHSFVKADQGCGEIGLAFPAAQVISDKTVVQEIAHRYWKTGEWREIGEWVQEI